MFGATESMKSFNMALTAHRFGMEESNPLVLLDMARIAKDNPQRTRLPTTLTIDWEIKLQDQGLAKRAGAIVVYTEKGMKLAQALAAELEPTFAERLQAMVRSVRQNLAEVDVPLPNRFWFRNIMWRIRTWWQDTQPQSRPIFNMEEIEPVLMWTERDEARQAKQWMESRFSAFWLCPSGPLAGVQHLNTIEELKKIHGAKCLEIAQAVESIAQLSAAIRIKPKPTPWSVVPATPLEIAIKRNEKAHEMIREELEWNKPTNEVIKFILVYGDTAKATPDEFGKSYKETNVAIASTSLNPNKNNKNRPLAFSLIADFDRALKQAQVLGKALDAGCDYADLIDEPEDYGDWMDRINAQDEDM